MKAIKYLTTLILIVVPFISGCSNPIYVKNIENTYSQLKIGMTKSELDELFGRFKFLKEQTVLKYPPGTTDEEMRLRLPNRYYNDLYPKDIFDIVTFDGDIKVFSYLVRRVFEWPNGWSTNYICIFYDKENDAVIGWSKMDTMRKVKDWGEKF